MSDMERANLPDEEGNYRVVQLYLCEEPYLFFSSHETHHDDVLRAALDYFHVVHEQTSAGPAASHAYRASGMGKAWVDPELRTDLFKGQNIDTAHLDKIEKLFPDWRLTARK